MHATTATEGAFASAIDDWRSRLPVRLLCLLLVLVSLGSLAAQQPSIDREAKIKAAYLYKFIRYVQWPDSVFTDASSPIVIGTVGDDPVNRYLRAIAKSRAAGKRSLVYKSISSPEQAESCHIVFFSDNAGDGTIETMVPNLSDSPVLLVGEQPDFLTTGGIISFVIVNNNVRLQLSMKAAENHQLKISSQLAKLAQIVN